MEMTEQERVNFPACAYTELLFKVRDPEAEEAKEFRRKYVNNQKVKDRLEVVTALWYAHKIL